MSSGSKTIDTGPNQSDNQTTTTTKDDRLFRATSVCFSLMAQYAFSTVPTTTSMALSETGSAVNPHSIAMDDLAHELRQPLSVIEALAYYLEITTADESVSGHLRQIQAMVLQASRILSNAAGH